MLEFETEGNADRVTALLPSLEGGRKVRAPLGRVLGNSQVPITGQPESGTESGTETYRPSSDGRIRVKSDGKSVRPTAVTQRRLNPTWSKAK
tara:strand:- start:1253 stop:1528 length:276 start_codon:yes stop_codon:yes gene_type:complete